MTVQVERLLQNEPELLAKYRASLLGSYVEDNAKVEASHRTYSRLRGVGITESGGCGSCVIGVVQECKNARA